MTAAAASTVDARPLTFRTLRWPADAGELRDVWNAVGSGVDTTYYQTYAWFACHAGNMEDDPSATRCYVAYRGETPVAIFPLRLSRQRIGGISTRALELPHGLHSLVCDCTFAASEDEAALMAALVSHLARSAEVRWDALVLPNLLEDRVTWLALSRSPSLSATVIEEPGCDYVLCSEFKPSSKHKQKRNNLQRTGLVAIEHVTAPSEVPAAFDDFLAVEASGWKGRNGTAVQSDPRVKDFYRAVAAAFADAGAIRVSTLRVEGHPIATSFALRGGRCLYLLKVGFDEGFAKFSPSFLLFEDLVRDCVARGDVDVINLITDVGWHQVLRPHHLPRRTAILFSNTLRARATRGSLAARRISRPMRSALRRLAGRLLSHDAVDSA